MISRGIFGRLWRRLFPEADPRIARWLQLEMAVRRLHDATWWSPLNVDATEADRLWNEVRRLAEIPQPAATGKNDNF